jgi:hypothetical protein
VDHADKEGKTALFAAASMGHLDILNILLFWGCYVDGIGQSVPLRGSTGVYNLIRNPAIPPPPFKMMFSLLLQYVDVYSSLFFLPLFCPFLYFRYPFTFRLLFIFRSVVFPIHPQFFFLFKFSPTPQTSSAGGWEG